MATITGRFGAVQRLLPKYTKIDMSEVAGAVDIPIWGWNGFSYKRINGKDSVVGWNVLDLLSSRNWDVKARMEESGHEPDDAETAHDASGQLIYSNMVSTVQSWSLDVEAVPQTYTASNLLGYNAKYAGVKSCKGSFKGIGAFPPVRPGDRFLFLGFVGPDNGQDLRLDEATKDYVDNRYGFVYQIAAIATNITISVNYSTFAPITWQVQWQSDYKNVGDELWVVGTPREAQGFYDYTPPPCAESQASRTYTLELKPNASCIGEGVKACLQEANITFNTQTQSVANSCSAAAGGWQSSSVGVTDCQIATTIHGSSFGVFSSMSADDPDMCVSDTNTPIGVESIMARSKKFYPGVDRYARIYLGDYETKAACGAWEFNKLYVGSFTGLNVDISGGGVVSFSTTLEFNASPKKYKLDGTGSTAVCTDTPDGCERGYIRYRLPDADRPELSGEADSVWKSFLNLKRVDEPGYKYTDGNYTGRTTANNHRLT
jgi:hypothetical protein